MIGYTTMLMKNYLWRNIMIEHIWFLLQIGLANFKDQNPTKTTKFKTSNHFSRATYNIWADLSLMSWKMFFNLQFYGFIMQLSYLKISLEIIGVLKKNRVNRAFDFRFVYVFSLVGPCRNDCQGRRQQGQ